MENLGQFAPLMKYVGTAVATGGALLATFRGRAAWEPPVSDLPVIQERLSALLSTISLIVLWIVFRDPESIPVLLRWTIGLTLGCVCAFLAYGALNSALTFDVVKVKPGPPPEPYKEKVVGGISLTPEAREQREQRKVTVQELFKGSLYNAEKIWSTPSRSLAKAVISATYLMLVTTGVSALAAGGLLLSLRAETPSPPPTDQLLHDAAVGWAASATSVADAAEVTHVWPADSLTKRATFEKAWGDTGDSARLSVKPPDLLSRALRATVESYRVQEENSPSKDLSVRWADEAVRYFRTASQKSQLVDALFDKAAILFDLAQLRHTNAQEFRSFAEDGDRTISEASQLAAPEQKVKLLRTWSRFYYGMALPQSGKLEDTWDGAYLGQALAKAEEAVKLDAHDLKSNVQLARTAERIGKSTEDGKNTSWTSRMREILTQLRTAWELENARTVAPRDRLAPLNILSVMTAEVLLREWLAMNATARKKAAPASLRELDEHSRPLQEELITLLRNTELQPTFSFDARFDLARILAVRYRFERASTPSSGNLDGVVDDLKLALQVATPTQRADFRTSMTSDPIFATLAVSERQMLGRLGSS
jgi:hypothetical protein